MPLKCKYQPKKDKRSSTIKFHNIFQETVTSNVLKSSGNFLTIIHRPFDDKHHVYLFKVVALRFSFF